LGDARKTITLNAGLTAVAGYETINRSEAMLPDGSTILDRDNFVYGTGGRLTLETYLSDRFVLLEYNTAALSAVPSSPSSLLTSPPLSSPGLSFSSPTFSVASPANASASSSMSIPSPAEPPFTSDADALALIYGNSYFGSDSDEDDFADY
jgi:hypothetical protein